MVPSTSCYWISSQFFLFVFPFINVVWNSGTPELVPLLYIFVARSCNMSGHWHVIYLPRGAHECMLAFDLRYYALCILSVPTATGSIRPHMYDFSSGTTPLFKLISIPVNTLGLRQNCRHFADDIFKCIFLNENLWISIKISQKFVSKFRIINIPVLIQIMAWRRPGDKPLSEPMIVYWHIYASLGLSELIWIHRSILDRNAVDMLIFWYVFFFMKLSPQSTYTRLPPYYSGDNELNILTLQTPASYIMFH